MTRVVITSRPVSSDGTILYGLSNETGIECGDEGEREGEVCQAETKVVFLSSKIRHVREL